MKFDLDKTKVELNIYGEKIVIGMPSERQVFEMREDITSAEEDVPKILLARRKFLVGLGIPEKTLMDMEFRHVTKLVEWLMGEVAGKKD